MLRIMTANNNHDYALVDDDNDCYSGRAIIIEWSEVNMETQGSLSAQSIFNSKFRRIA